MAGENEVTDEQVDPKAVPERVHKGPRPAFDFESMSACGVLWLINRVVFHPRGYALALEYADGEPHPYGWSIQGDGSEVWSFQLDEDEKFAAVEALLAQAARFGKAPHIGPEES